MESTYVLICVGAVLGASARYLVGSLVAEQLGGQRPHGTPAVSEFPYHRALYSSYDDPDCPTTPR
jgi:hypothetical protein